MAVLSIGEILERVSILGGSLTLNGERVSLELPDCPEADAVAESVRRNRDAIAAMLTDAESKPPSLAEVQAALPPGVRLLSYRPKEAPFVLAPASLVTNSGKFYRAYLSDLARRLEKPEGYHTPPLTDILAKLADGGLELQIERIA